MVNSFIQKLINNPNFQGQPLSLVETHISNFVNQNIQNLSGMLTSDQFFPGKSQDEAKEELLTRVRTYIAENIKNRTLSLMNDHIQYDIISAINQNHSGNKEEIIKEFSALFETIISHRDVRQKLDSLNNLLEAGSFDKYIMATYDDKGYLYNELFRVESHHLKPEELKEYIKISALLVPIYHVALNLPEFGLQNVHAFALRERANQLKIYFEKIEAIVKKIITRIPEDFWQTARNSFTDITAETDIDPAGKFLAIMFLRGRDMRKNQKAEKGAETPDKSWFSVQIRNAQYLGLDKKMLENLNRMAFDLNL